MNFPPSTKLDGVTSHNAVICRFAPREALKFLVFAVILIL